MSITLSKWHSWSELVNDCRTGWTGCFDLLVAFKSYHKSVLNVNLITFSVSFEG